MNAGCVLKESNVAAPEMPKKVGFKKCSTTPSKIPSKRS